MIADRKTVETDAEANAEGQGVMADSVSTDFARRLERERDAAVEELRNIANAVLSTWDKDMRDQFQAWAQNRARATLRAIEEGRK